MNGFSVNRGGFFRFIGEQLLGRTRPGEGELRGLITGMLHDSAAELRGGAVPCQRCSLLLPVKANPDVPCVDCQGKQLIPEQTIALGDYAVGLGALVAAAKYGRWALPLDILGEHLGVELMLELNRSAQPILVPMPSPFLRRLHRGLFHAGVIATAVHRVTGWPLASGLWRRWVATQVGATTSSREKGGGGLKARKGFLQAIAGREVVLIDDVRTSGKSLERASRFCRRLGAARVSAGIVATKRPSERTRAFNPA